MDSIDGSDVIPYIGKAISWVQRPILEVYYDKKETYHYARDLSNNGIVGLFLHVMVRNKGKSTAKKVKGELVEIQQWQTNKYVNLSNLYRNTMQLKWAHEDSYKCKDIQPSDAIRLDVCYVHEGTDVIHFFTKKYPSGNQTDFLPGKYTITIRIVSENANSITEKFVVEYFAGKFNSLKIGNWTL